MGLGSAVALIIVAFELCYGAVIKTEQRKSIDAMIMHGAKDTRMFDVMHAMPSGKMMMMVELDIFMSVEEYNELQRDPYTHTRGKRKAVAELFDRKWKEGNVFYEVGDLKGKQPEQVIQSAIDEWEKSTCLNFTLAGPNTVDRILFTDGMGCYSSLGRAGGTQEVVLAEECMEKRVVIHEIGHAIGWTHEHSRPDRDQFIRVNWNRIPPEWQDQFQKYNEMQIKDHSVVYDYRSIMHYGGDLVSPKSIETLNPMYQDVIGMSDGLSYKDIKLANIMYDCAGKSVSGGCSNNCSMYSESYQDKDCTCMCPGDGTSSVVPCSQLPTEPTRRPTAPPTIPPTKDQTVECRDISYDCDRRVDAGDCSMKPGNMALFCRKSCNFCDSGACMDYEVSCPLLAVGGFCELPGHEFFMQRRCKMSCGKCTPTDGCTMLRDLGQALPSPTPKGNGGQKVISWKGVVFSFVGVVLLICK